MPLNLGSIVKVSLSMLLSFLVFALGLTGYNFYQLTVLNGEHARAVNSISTEKQEAVQKLKGLEDFEEKISFFLGGALTDREGVRTALDKGSYSGGIGGGNDSGKNGKGDILLPLETEVAIREQEREIPDNSDIGLRISLLQGRLDELSNLAEKEKTRLDYTPSILPSSGYITSRFGWRNCPFTGERQIHRGIDVVNKIGTPVRATAAGRVIFAGKEVYWGNAVFIEHQKGVVTKYGHMSSLNVKVGDQVTRGQLIGNIGMTGRTTGPHVHYQIEIDEQVVNPMQFIIDERRYN